MFVNFKLDKDELISFYSENIIKTKTFKIGRFILVLYCIGITLLVWNITSRIVFRIQAIFASLIFCIFFKLIAKKSYIYMLNKRYNDSKSLVIFENTELYLKEEGICIINSIEEREVNYDSITRINIFDNYLFIIISKKQYFTIPLKDFNYKDDKSNFINLLEQKINRKIVYEYPDALDYR